MYNLFINVNFESEKYPFNFHSLQSFHSILDQIKSKLNLPNHQYSLYFNSTLIELNKCPDDYNIQNNDIIYIKPQLLGGKSKSLENFKKYWYVYLISILVILITGFFLGLGYYPLLSILVKIMITNVFETFGVYLTCVLGKHQLYKRFKFIIDIIKYIFLFIIVYVSLTLPFILLTFMVKGGNIFEGPKNMCSPLNAANITGLILTVLYFMIYFCYRGFKPLFKYLNNIFKKSSITDATLVPITGAVEKTADTLKYIPVKILQPGTTLYFSMIDNMTEYVTTLLNTVMAQINQKMPVLNDENFDPNQLFKDTPHMKNQFAESLNINMTKNNHDNIKDIAQYTENISTLQKSPALNLNNVITKENMNKIGNILYSILMQCDSGSPEIMKYCNLLKDYNFYLPAILVTQAFIEFSPNSNSPENKKKLQDLENKIKLYNEENNQAYIPTFKNTTFSTLKMMYYYMINNIFNLIKNTNFTIHEIGSMFEINDILKAGYSTGSIIAVCYFICIIALIICGLFKMY